MPSTRSSAATKCISEVPGLAKQASTPPLTSVRTRLSAPFIVPLPLTFLDRGADQPLFQLPVTAHGRIAGIASSAGVVFPQRLSGKLTAHAAVACEIEPFMASLATKSVCEEQ